MAGRKFNLLVLLPPLLFLGFALAAWFALRSENAGELPSALIGKPAPSFEKLTDFGGAPAPSDADLRQPSVKLVNFWASWCGPCRVEHPLLIELGAGDIPLIGINYKDTPGNAESFLTELGNPYDMVGTDSTGRTGIDWGIYGVPETFVIGPDGTILFRHPGPMTRDVLEKRILPVIDQAGG